MKTTYDELRSSTDPVGEIVDYYKSQLCDGESLWWTGKITKDEQTEAAPMKIRLWRTLSTDEKRKLVTTGLVLFPDMLSETSTRYERFSLWLVAKHGVVSTSLRDSFSAGGQDTLITENDVFDNIPRKINNRRAELCGIEDLSLKDLRLRGNKSPAPPVEPPQRGAVLTAQGLRP